MPLPYSLLSQESAEVYLLRYSTGGVIVRLLAGCLCSLVWVEVPSVAVTILLISNLWINPTIGGSTPNSVRDSVIAVGITSLKAPSVCVYFLMLSDFSMLLTTKCSAYLVDLPLVQGCCASDIFVGSIMALMCRLISFSKLFSRNDVRLIGLKSFAVV